MANNLFDTFKELTVKDFLNDADHILKYHDKAISQQLFPNMIGVCDSDSCALYCRSYTERTRNRQRQRDHFLLDSNNIDIDTESFVRIAFIEEIHSYLFHSIPSINESGQNENISQILKQYRTCNADRLSRYDMGNTTNCDERKQNNVNNQERRPTLSNSHQSGDDQELIYDDIVNIHGFEQPGLGRIYNPDFVYSGDMKQSGGPGQVSPSNSVFSDSDSNNNTDQPPFSYGWKFEYNFFTADGRKNKYYVGCKWGMYA